MLQVRSNPVPGGQHTSQRIAEYYVNPGLLRRISSVRIASAVAASQRRAGRSPALSRRIAPGRWTGDASAHGAGKPPRRYAAPLPIGEFTGEGGFETRPYVSPSKPIPLLGGVPPAGGGVVSPQGATPVQTQRL
ncbi:MAG: hypothetical protein LBM98_11165 [Oscillospiraceae bacterium]|nr:hypothetical protein [Oscillospiraceae bacterium]